MTAKPALITPIEVPFTHYRAHARLRYLWKLLQISGMFMTAERIKTLIYEMICCLHDATPETDKAYQRENFGSYTHGQMDGWSWNSMDECYVMDYSTVDFDYGDITIKLTYAEGDAVLVWADERTGYNRIVEWNGTSAKVVVPFTGDC